VTLLLLLLLLLFLHIFDGWCPRKDVLHMRGCSMAFQYAVAVHRLVNTGSHTRPPRVMHCCQHSRMHCVARLACVRMVERPSGQRVHGSVLGLPALRMLPSSVCADLTVASAGSGW
jgi:hypothetical protein